MSRSIRHLIALAAISLMFVGVGCSKNDAGMENDSQARANELAALQAELDAARDQRMRDQDQINALMARNEQLQSELNANTKEQPAPGWSSVPGGAMVSIEGTVLFDSGKAQLKSSSYATLNRIAATLKQKYADHDIYVFGHTDAQPIKESDWKDNDELSCQRALSVLRYLKKQGVPGKIAAGGWGAQLPVAPGTVNVKNRRVEVYAMRPFEEVVRNPRQ